jgi:hypothetical protein
MPRLLRTTNWQFPYLAQPAARLVGAALGLSLGCSSAADLGAHLPSSALRRLPAVVPVAASQRSEFPGLAQAVGEAPTTWVRDVRVGVAPENATTFAGVLSKNGFSRFELDAPVDLEFDNPARGMTVGGWISAGYTSGDLGQ